MGNTKEKGYDIMGMKLYASQVSSLQNQIKQIQQSLNLPSNKIINTSISAPGSSFGSKVSSEQDTIKSIQQRIPIKQPIINKYDIPKGLKA